MAARGSIVVVKALTDRKIKPDFAEIAAVSVLALILGAFLSLATTRKWLYDFAHLTKISRRFGDANVWSLALNSSTAQWATVRDLENNFMFMGYIQAFSELEDPAEILITDVTVYNETTGEQLYTADMMYIARKRETLTVEFPTPV